MRPTFKSDLGSRFVLRHHMAAILVASIAGGVVANFVLLSFGIERMILRYPGSVVASFLTFVFAMRVWLSYLSGTYSPPASLSELEEEPTPPPESEENQDSKWSALDFLNSPTTDIDPCGCLLVVFVLAIGLFAGSALVLMYEAPLILADIAFQFFLAAGLIRSARRIDSPDWVGSVISHTWKPFTLVLAATMVFSYVAELACDNPRGIRQMIESCGKR